MAARPWYRPAFIEIFLPFAKPVFRRRVKFTWDLLWGIFGLIVIAGTLGAYVLSGRLWRDFWGR